MLLNAKNDKLCKKYTMHLTKLREIHMTGRDFPLNVDKGHLYIYDRTFHSGIFKIDQSKRKKKIQNRGVLLYF